MTYSELFSNDKRLQQNTVGERTMTRLRLGIEKANLNQCLLFGLICFPFLYPEHLLSQYVIVNILIDLWQYASLAIMLGLFITHRKSWRFPICILSGCYLILIVSTLRNSGDYSVIRHSAQVLLCCLTIGVVADNERMKIPFLLVVRDLTVVFFFMNLLCEFISPNGMYEDYDELLFLYGNVNSTLRHVIPGICCSLILDRKRDSLSLVTLFFFLGMIISSVFIYIMATALLAVLIIALWMVFRRFLQPHLWKLLLVGFVIILFIEISVVITYNNTFVISVLTKVFNKSSDFSNRFMLWERTMSSIVEKPLFGYGLQDLQTILNTIGNRFGSHNYYLDVTYQRGFIGLALFLSFLLYPLIAADRKQTKGKELYVLAGCSLAMEVYFLGEPIFNQEHLILPMLYALCLYIPRKKSDDASCSVDTEPD